MKKIRENKRLKFCDSKDESIITISRAEARKAIDCCLKNSRSFIDDVKISIENNKIDHIAIPIQFALEEIGKAKIIFDKLHDGEDELTLTKDDGFCNHTKKLDIAANLIESNPDIGIIFHDANPYPPEELYGPSPFPPYPHRKIALEGHRVRLDTSFVDFDVYTKEPVLDIILPSKLAQIGYLREQISSIIDKYPKSFSNDSRR